MRASSFAVLFLCSLAACTESPPPGNADVAIDTAIDGTADVDPQCATAPYLQFCPCTTEGELHCMPPGSPSGVMCIAGHWQAVSDCSGIPDVQRDVEATAD